MSFPISVFVLVKYSFSSGVCSNCDVIWNIICSVSRTMFVPIALRYISWAAPLFCVFFRFRIPVFSFVVFSFRSFMLTLRVLVCSVSVLVSSGWGVWVSVGVILVIFFLVF